MTYSHAISNLTPPVSSSMAQLFGDSDPLKQKHRRICSLSTFYFVYASGLFSCFVRIDGWPTGRCRELCQQLYRFKPCTDKFPQLRMYQSSQSQHPNPSTTCISQPKLVSASLQISPVSFSQYAKPGSVASVHGVPLDHRDLPMLAASIHCDRIRVTCSSPECPPSSHRLEKGGVGH